MGRSGIACSGTACTGISYAGTERTGIAYSGTVCTGISFRGMERVGIACFYKSGPLGPQPLKFKLRYEIIVLWHLAQHADNRDKSERNEYWS